MFVDASALVAILAPESDGLQLEARLAQTWPIFTSAIALFETSLGLARLREKPLVDIEPIVRRYVEALKIEFVAIDAEIGVVAIDAFQRFGKGRHVARLNMGDCFAYACARVRKVPLLCKGDDFRQTDIRLA
jgi:ribonuclease VapC